MDGLGRMKTLLLCICFLCLAGCEQRKNGQIRSRPTYPALNQSPFPPPPQTVYTTPNELNFANTNTELLAEIAEDSGFYRDVEKLDTINRLHETAINSCPDNPFALTKQEIEALYQLDTLILY